jgi:hypothetical protein
MTFIQTYILGVSHVKTSIAEDQWATVYVHTPSFVFDSNLGVFYKKQEIQP